MKRILAAILLLSHINFSMFIAQVDEVDSFDANGCQNNDINSLVEYVDQVVLGHDDKSVPDADDDNARYFHLMKVSDYCFSQQVILLDAKINAKDRKNSFPLVSGQKTHSGFHDIIIPPPKVSILTAFAA